MGDDHQHVASRVAALVHVAAIGKERGRGLGGGGEASILTVREHTLLLVCLNQARPGVWQGRVMPTVKVVAYERRVSYCLRVPSSLAEKKR